MFISSILAFTTKYTPNMVQNIIIPSPINTGKLSIYFSITPLSLKWTKSSRKCKEYKNVVVGRPSQCIYRMIQGFLTHGILLCMVFIYGFLPILIFRGFWSFLERVGINQNKCSTSLHLLGRNNRVLEHIWWNFSC